MNMLVRRDLGGRLGWVAAVLLSLPAISMAQQIAIGGYPVPTEPAYITTGPDGALWFTESKGNRIGRMTTAGAITEFPLPTAGSSPQGITAGPDGALWFTEYGNIGAGNKIGRITTAGAVTEYPLPTFSSVAPLGITAGPDGALWFTEHQGNRIGRITTAGQISQYPVPTANSQPYWITAGPDGSLWFTEYNGGRIGQITTAGAITEYSGAAYPLGITAGPDGALWFAQEYGIGRITTAGVVTQFNDYINATGITAGPDGALWFTETGYIGRITTAGVITQYKIPDGSSDAQGIATGPDGELWFTEIIERQIGEAVFVTASLSASPASGFYGTNLTFTGSTFAANELVYIYLSGVGSPILARAAADSTGSFTISALEAQSPYGPRLFLGVGQTSGKLGAASFSVTPRLIVHPNSGSAGSTVTVQGYGFAPAENVDIYWNTSVTLLGSGRTNNIGTFNGDEEFTFTVPSGAAMGANSVVAIQPIVGGHHIHAVATFTVQ